MNRVTIKTLRFYDEQGLLKPCKVDKWTGYRYYSGEAILKLHKILALRQIGFSIKEIKETLSKNITHDDLICILTAKKAETATVIEDEKAKLSRIESLINELTKENAMEQNVIIKEIPGVVVASMRRTIKNYHEFNSFYPEMGNLMAKHKVKCATPGYCFSLYHDGEYKDKDIDVEICEAVDKMYESRDGITYKEIPEVTVASVLHKGPYNTIGKSYKIAFDWIDSNGYEIADLPRESYIDGCWNKENSEEWLTEVQVPIRKK